MHRARTTFCWFPPLNDMIDASGEDALMLTVENQRATSPSSRLVLRLARLRSRPRADRDRFSLTLIWAMTPCPERSDGTIGVVGRAGADASTQEPPSCGNCT